MSLEKNITQDQLPISPTLGNHLKKGETLETKQEISTLEEFFSDAEKLIIVQQFLDEHPTIPHLKDNFLKYLQNNAEVKEEFTKLQLPADVELYKSTLQTYMGECIRNETIPSFQISPAEQAIRQQIQKEQQRQQEEQQRQQKELENQIEKKDTFEEFKSAQEREFAQHPGLQAAVTSSPEYQHNKQLLDNPATLSQLQARGISQEMVESYLLGQATFDLAQQQGITLSTEYTSAFKNFEQSLDLPEGIFSFKKIEISADVRTHTPDTLIQELSTDTRALFDPDTGSKALEKGYDKSRERHSAIYEMVERKLDDKELFQTYGTSADQTLYQEILTIYQTLSREKRPPTPEEKQKFDEIQKIREILLQKQHEYEETIKLAMGRSFISGQAIQHLKRLNSTTGNTFNFNPANAFDLQGDFLTTTVYNA
ncbi:MAG: hypothetical protein LBU27_01835 [Candidatus Peribacteria bacterium]|jgi:cell fate (sporulation/competence/biofilm development) regulator YlbF (YheA/YmcA/DUF963 family)|nr:hypothetical protein [Candidatus Peribacteria bacterium]